MMISMKRVLPKTLPFVLIVFAVFTVSLTENLQLADGFLSQSTAGWKYEMQVGETQVGTWTLLNTTEEPINVQFVAEGQGAELFVFEEFVTMEPNTQNDYEFIVTVPKDHPDNIEYHPNLYALQIGEAQEGGAAVVVFKYRMLAEPKIIIGDNPVFTPEEKPEPVEEPTPAPVANDDELTFESAEEKPMETIEEKMARIQAANQAKAPEEVKVDDVWEEEFEEEAVVDYEPEPYVAEPTEALRPAPHQEEVKECDFIAMFLSWFGLAEC